MSLDAAEPVVTPLALVGREWVHKQIESNVFIGRPAALGDNAFSTESYFPIRHQVYNDCVSGLSGSGYIIEVARQVNLALSHLFYEVPLTAAFLITIMDWAFTDDAPFVAAERFPFSIETSVLEVGRRKGVVSKLVTQNSLCSGGKTFWRGGATFLIASRPLGSSKQSDDVQATQFEPVTPAEAQVSEPSNILIGQETETAAGRKIPLIVDPKHGYFFEHSNGHVPGMMLLEGGKQAAVHAARQTFSVLSGLYGDLHSGEMRFGRLADLKRPIWMSCHFVAVEETRNGFRLPVEIVFEQGEVEIGRIRGALSFSDLREVLQTSALLRPLADASDTSGAEADGRREAL